MPALWSGLLEQISNKPIAMGFLKHYRKRGQCLFTVHSVLPHLLAVSAYSEGKHIYACAHTCTSPTTADPVKAWSLCFSVQGWASVWILQHPERLEAFLSAGHHLSCHSLKFPYFHDPSKGLCKSFSLSSGWNWPAHPEAAAQKGEIQAGRVVHTHLQRGSTILISLGNQIKNHLTLCQL